MRSVSHCGQTISLYTLHPTWCQRSYTISTKREITSQKVHIVPFFFLSYRLQMKSQWKGLSLTESCIFILTSFTLALQHNRDSPDSATVFFFLSTFPNLQLSQILYMGGTIIPGITALWEKRGR